MNNSFCQQVSRCSQAVSIHLQVVKVFKEKKYTFDRQTNNEIHKKTEWNCILCFQNEGSGRKLTAMFDQILLIIDSSKPFLEVSASMADV